jgi:hypothetical protein
LDDFLAMPFNFRKELPQKCTERAKSLLFGRVVSMHGVWGSLLAAGTQLQREGFGFFQPSRHNFASDLGQP